MTPTPQDGGPLAASIRAHLREAILRGDFAPGERLREVEIAAGPERVALLGREQREQHRFDVVARQLAAAFGDELAADAQHRRIARRQMEIRAAAFEQLVEQARK